MLKFTLWLLRYTHEISFLH